MGNPNMTSVVKMGAMVGGCFVKRNTVGRVNIRDATHRMKIKMTR